MTRNEAARAAGKPCTITDAHLSPQSRADVEQNDNFFADLRAELRGTQE